MTNVNDEVTIDRDDLTMSMRKTLGAMAVAFFVPLVYHRASRPPSGLANVKGRLATATRHWVRVENEGMLASLRRGRLGLAVDRTIGAPFRACDQVELYACKIFNPSSPRSSCLADSMASHAG